MLHCYWCEGEIITCTSLQNALLYTDHFIGKKDVVINSGIYCIQVQLHIKWTKWARDGLAYQGAWGWCARRSTVQNLGKFCTLEGNFAFWQKCIRFIQKSHNGGKFWWYSWDICIFSRPDCHIQIYNIDFIISASVCYFYAKSYSYHTPRLGLSMRKIY